MGPPPHRPLALLLAILLVVGALPVGAAPSPAVDPLAAHSPGAARPTTPGAGQTVGTESAPTSSARADDGPAPNTTTHRLTLLTGERLRLELSGTGTNRSVGAVEVVAGGPVHVMEANGRTYLLPDDLDLATYDRSAFALDALLDAESSAGLPVLLHVEGPVDAVSVPGAADVRRLRSSGVIAVTVEDQAARGAVAALVANGTVERVALDPRFERAAVAGGAGAAGVPTVQATGAGVTVAVLDTGIDATHPDLADRVVDRVDLVDDVGGPLDPNGHGTHVAGVVAGTGAASNGTHAGVAPDASLLDVRVLDERGSGRASTIVAGIEAAVAADADVVVLAVASTIDGSETVAEGAAWAAERGTVVVAAAGNHGRPRTIGAPGRPPGVITVGASDGGARIEPYSSMGPTLDGHLKPELAAPGTGRRGPRSAQSDRFAADDAGRYTRIGGTSVAAPQVAGAAALLLESAPGLDADAIEGRLASTARPIAGAGVFAQGGGVLDVERALDPDVDAHPGVVDLGLVESDAVLERTVVFENHDDRPHVLELGTTLRNADLGRTVEGVAALNHTTLSLSPGERAAVRLTVDADTPSGAHAGAITYAVDGEPRTVPFGFVRGGTVTVEKRPLAAGGAVDGDELWVLNERGTHDELLQFENGTASFVAGGGTYLLWSAGTDEATDATVFLSERRRFDGPGRVVLDERDTVEVGVDASPLVERYGRLANRSVAVSLSTDYGPATARRSLLRKDTDSRVVRVSRDPALDVATAHLLTPETEGAPLDVADVFYLVAGVDGVGGPSLEEATPEALETVTHRYHRRTVDETYRVQDRAAIRGVWNRPARRYFALGGRRVQRIHRFPGAASYDRSYRGEGWAAARGVDGDRGEPVDVLAHPMVGVLALEYAKSGTVSASAIPFADGAGTRYDPGGDHALTALVNGSTVASRQLEGSRGGFDELPAGPSDRLTVRLEGANEDGRLSTRTLTEVTLPPNATEPSRRTPVVDRPPTVTGLRVLGADAANAVPAGPVTVAADVDLVGAVSAPRVWLATGSPTEPPWENATGWRQAGTRRLGDRVLGTARVPAGTDRLGVAASLTDTRGRRVRTMTLDAAHVGAAPNASTAVLAGQLLAADGTPLAGDAVALRRAEGGAARYLRLDDEGRLSVELPRGRAYDLVYLRRDDTETAAPRPDASRPIWWPIGRVRIDDDGVDLGSRRLPEPGRLAVTVTDERGGPVADARVRLVQQRRNISLSDVLPTGRDGTARRFGSPGPGIAMAGTVTVEVTPPEGPYTERTYRRTVAVDGDRRPEIVLETVPPTAAIAAYGTFEPDAPVFVHARRSRVPAGAAEYRWDLDGDGAADRVTERPEIRYVPTASTLEPTVTVVDAAGKTASATMRIELRDG